MKAIREQLLFRFKRWKRSSFLSAITTTSGSKGHSWVILKINLNGIERDEFYTVQLMIASGESQLLLSKDQVYELADLLLEAKSIIELS